MDIITIDIDWSPDFIIKEIMNILIDNKVKTTWFATHKSAMVDNLINNDLFEIGIHPNCLMGSTQGNTEDEVLTNLKNLFPDAISMRTHSLYQTTPFLEKSSKIYGIKNDVSLYIPGNIDIIRPHKIMYEKSSLLRIPYIWEDDMEIFKDNPMWHIDNKKLPLGIRIFDFHPPRILSNFNNNNFKEIFSKNRNKWDLEFFETNRYKGDGTFTLFMELVEKNKNGGLKIKEIMENIS